jgi:serine protease Do
MIDDISTSARDVLTRVSASVVGIGSRRHGCGFVFAPGRVATNAHNVHAEEVAVNFADGSQGVGRAVGLDIESDLAVLEVDTDAPALTFADASASAGDAVFAVTRGVGNVERISFGLVSALPVSFLGPRGSRISGAIEHTAPLVRGSSGSPIVDATGAVVGINTHRPGEGFYLAIPASKRLQDELSGLATGTRVERPRLGIAAAPTEVARALRRAVGLPERDGVLVRRVEDGSRAETAGVGEGDLIVALDGQPVASVEALLDVLAAADNTKELTLSVIRGTEEVTLTLPPAT